MKYKIKELGWVSLFFLILTALTLPTILLSRAYSFEVTIFHQAFIVMITNWLSTKIYGGFIVQFTGTFDSVSLRNLKLGFMMGIALMLIPATILSLGGCVWWEVQPFNTQSILTTCATVVAGVITEEFLFRGFIFQRLLSFGVWPAQILVSAYFLLTHTSNLPVSLEVKFFAMTNIFLASVVFGIAVIKTKSLTMAIALHAGANLVQGTLLGFGVSGHAQQSVFHPLLSDAPIWLTGGEFGLEGSLPGLLSLLVLTMLLIKWKLSFNVK